MRIDFSSDSLVQDCIATKDFRTELVIIEKHMILHLAVTIFSNYVVAMYSLCGEISSYR